MTRKDDEDLLNVGFTIMFILRVTSDHCHITGKYRGSAQEIVISMLNQIIKFPCYSAT